MYVLRHMLASVLLMVLCTIVSPPVFATGPEVSTSEHVGLPCMTIAETETMVREATNTNADGLGVPASPHAIATMPDLYGPEVSFMVCQPTKFPNSYLLVMINYITSDFRYRPSKGTEVQFMNQPTKWPTVASVSLPDARQLTLDLGFRPSKV